MKKENDKDSILKKMQGGEFRNVMKTMAEKKSKYVTDPDFYGVTSKGRKLRQEVLDVLKKQKLRKLTVTTEVITRVGSSDNTTIYKVNDENGEFYIYMIVRGNSFYLSEVKCGGVHSKGIMCSNEQAYEIYRLILTIPNGDMKRPLDALDAIKDDGKVKELIPGVDKLFEGI